MQYLDLKTMLGDCVDVSDHGSLVCAGTSVLNDGVITCTYQVLMELSLTQYCYGHLSCLGSDWNTWKNCIWSWKSKNHDRIAWSWLCSTVPAEMRIGLSSFSICFGSSFRPIIWNGGFTPRHWTFILESQLHGEHLSPVINYSYLYSVSQWNIATTKLRWRTET